MMTVDDDDDDDDDDVILMNTLGVCLTGPLFHSFSTGGYSRLGRYSTANCWQLSQQNFTGWMPFLSPNQ